MLFHFLYMNNGQLIVAEFIVIYFDSQTCFLAGIEFQEYT